MTEKVRMVSAAEAAEELAAMGRFLAEVEGRPVGQPWAEVVGVMEELRGDFDGEG